MKYKIEIELCKGLKFVYPPAMVISEGAYPELKRVVPIRRHPDGSWHYAAYGTMSGRSMIPKDESEVIEAAYMKLINEEIVGAAERPEKP